MLDYEYCPRRWYLHFIEYQNEENVLIVECKIEHEPVDKCSSFVKNGILTLTNFSVWNNFYDIYGICDCVEFVPDNNGIITEYSKSPVKIYPVEYKHGKVRDCNEYKIQLTAQAICLEEMFNCEIDVGYIFFPKENSRFEVKIDYKLRNRAIEIISQINSYNGELIKPQYNRKCQGCSLYEICNPREYNIQNYLNLLWGD